MISDQGEFALIIEADENGIPIKSISYTTPAKGKIFAEDEKRDIYLAAVMNKTTLEDESKLMLDAYLTRSCDFMGKDQLYQERENEIALPSNVESKRRIDIEQQLLLERKESEARGINNQHKEYATPQDGTPREVCECDSCMLTAQFATKKYKPVVLKVKPIMGTLPEQFRIKRKITGDPLADMPELKPKPLDFEPKGRYTEERKEAMDKVHNGDFLWPEERKLVHHLISEQNEAFA